MKTYTCNVCGKSYGLKTLEQPLSIETRFGYGSKYDGDRFDLDVCHNCLEVFLSAIGKICSVSPLIDQEY